MITAPSQYQKFVPTEQKSAATHIPCQLEIGASPEFDNNLFSLALSWFYHLLSFLFFVFGKKKDKTSLCVRARAREMRAWSFMKASVLCINHALIFVY